MKKRILALSILFLLGGCAEVSDYAPTSGGTYDSVKDEQKLVEEARRVIELQVLTSPENVYVGETLCKNDILLKAIFNDETEEEVNPEIIQLDTSRAGTRNGVAIYGGVSTTFLVTVLDQPVALEKVAVGISEVTFPDNIYVGSTVKLEDVTMYVFFDDGSYEKTHPTSMEIDTSSSGTYDVKVTYGDAIKIVQVTILGSGGEVTPEATLTGISVVNYPTHVLLNGTITASDLSVQANYSDGTSQTVTPSSIAVDTSVVGTAIVTVTYNGLTSTFAVQVYDDTPQEKTITGIEVLSSPSMVDVGDPVTKDDITITIKYSDNTVSTAHPDNVVVSTSVAGNISGTVYYGDFDASFSLYVYDPAGDDADEEDVVMSIYNIYFSYNHTTTYNPSTKKDVDAPLITFTTPMLAPYGQVPAEIAKDGDNTKIDTAKFIALGEAKGFSVDPAFPTFIGLSSYGLCLDESQLWNFQTDYKQVNVISLYGVWVSNEAF